MSSAYREYEYNAAVFFFLLKVTKIEFTIDLRSGSLGWKILWGDIFQKNLKSNNKIMDFFNSVFTEF